jgi:hypothetical protein
MKLGSVMAAVTFHFSYCRNPLFRFVFVFLFLLPLLYLLLHTFPIKHSAPSPLPILINSHMDRHAAFSSVDLSAILMM